MIDSCVEVHFIIFVVTFYFNLSELAVPVSFGCSQIFVEVVFGDFSLQVLGSSFHADAGNGCADKYLLAFLSVEVEACDSSCADTFVLFDDSHCIQFYFLERLGEAGTEVDVLISCPAVRETVTLDSDGVYHLNVRVVGKVPIHRFLQVQEDSGLSFGKGIPLDTAAFGCRQFDVDIIIGQAYLIIACIGAFVIVGELGVNAQWSFCFFVRQRNRHKRDIIQISSSGTGEVRVAESGNRAVRVKISGDAVPAGESVIRTKLYHSKWRLCARISVSGEVCSYKWIYIRCVIYFMFLLCRGTRNQHAD